MIEPFGAHPTSCHPHYVQDYAHVLDYYDRSVDETLDQYIAEYISDSDEAEYQSKIGLKRFHDLQRMMDISRAAVGGK